jgi:hypothetical protein
MVSPILALILPVDSSEERNILTNATENTRSTREKANSAPQPTTLAKYSVRIFDVGVAIAVLLAGAKLIKLMLQHS